MGEESVVLAYSNIVIFLNFHKMSKVWHQNLPIRKLQGEMD